MVEVTNSMKEYFFFDIVQMILLREKTVNASGQRHWLHVYRWSVMKNPVEPAGSSQENLPGIIRDCLMSRQPGGSRLCRHWPAGM